MVAGPVADCKHSNGCGVDVDEMKKPQLINGTGCFCTLNLT